MTTLNDHPTELDSRWVRQDDGGNGTHWYCVFFRNLNHDPKGGYQERWGINQRTFRQEYMRDSMILRGLLTRAEYDALLTEIPEDAAK